ncbi:MAG: RluA family pseudouridine synthase, partial [Oscillibacter sp.]|nr:RluA family pseudouridine synthase [Oscillibacter sp.]
MTFPVQETDGGRRLDAWLPEQREGLTRSAAARLCEEGRVRRDGQPLPKNARLKAGEAVTVDFPAPEPMEAVPQNIPLDVVYEDGDVIVVNKPAGLVVHPAPGHPDGTLVNALLYHCGGPAGMEVGGTDGLSDGDAVSGTESGGTEGLHGTGYGGLSGIGGVLRPGIVHRIDRDTSGLIIAAKNDAAHQALAAQLKDHTLARTYRCIVVGHLREDAGTVDAPVGRSRTDRKR